MAAYQHQRYQARGGAGGNGGGATGVLAYRPASTQSMPATATQTITQTPVLRLRAEATLTGSGSGSTARRRIQWAEDVIDNEGMGKKKSKVCCIYHAPRPVGESSSESSSDSSSSDSDSDSDDDGRARMSGRNKNNRKNGRRRTDNDSFDADHVHPHSSANDGHEAGDCSHDHHPGHARDSIIGVGGPSTMPSIIPRAAAPAPVDRSLRRDRGRNAYERVPKSTTKAVEVK